MPTRRLVPLRREGPPRSASRAERDLLGQRFRPARLRYPGGRKKLATERLQNNRPEQFYDQAYPLPPELTKGKSQVTVTFKAHPRQIAGGIFGSAQSCLADDMRSVGSGQTTGSLSGATSSTNPDFPTRPRWGYETGFCGTTSGSSTPARGRKTLGWKTAC